MMYITIPIFVVLVIGLLCLNIKLGFIALEKTEGTGFNFGYYMMTVVGLIAAEISLAAYIIGRLVL